MPIITLTTDFGWRDGYVGAVKGVISRLAPEVTIVDIAHDIPRGDIAHAAWVVATSASEFPRGTIHVVVVDPGVGGDRRGVIARVPFAPGRTHMFVGPDNGVFGYLPVDKAWAIAIGTSTAVSPTFHGRDVFAPVAASIAKQHTEFYGEVVALEGALPWGPRKPYTGRVVHIDHYGNLITDLPREESNTYVRFGNHAHIPIVPTYSAVQSGLLLAYIGSAGTMELAVRDGRADITLDAKRGDVVESVHELPPRDGPYR